jgi:hypothetical protein
MRLLVDALGYHDDHVATDDRARPGNHDHDADTQLQQLRFACLV